MEHVVVCRAELRIFQINAARILLSEGHIDHQGWRGRHGPILVIGVGRAGFSDLNRHLVIGAETAVADFGVASDRLGKAGDGGMCLGYGVLAAPKNRSLLVEALT